MPVVQTAQDTIESIQSAPTTEPHEAVSRRLGVSVSTVRKYRRAARAIRQEATREIIAEHAREHVTDALADLTELRTLAADIYRNSRFHKDGGLWLAAIRTEQLLSSGAPRDEFAEMTDEELEAFATGAGEAGAGPEGAPEA